eukprot:TRINITY_DN5646_c0_g1_i1.p1 TRINITY_DN5646_c0_g1~~TRINITY_DN5646_c0_g1_i1.p1  ORF type:complete len:247 (-),score=68.84 TRINITY_DN5646_c0_g1_i1:40-735(-)
MPKEVFKRRTYRERSQPSARRKLGFLEKHKDYVKRAQNYHMKKRMLQKMREQAAQRNPDEFTKKMRLFRTKEGVPYLPHNAPQYTPDEIALMKTQDTTYLQMRKVMDLRKIERLQANLHCIGTEHKNKHVLFADSTEEAHQLVKQSDETPQGLLFKPAPGQLAQQPLMVGVNRVTPMALKQLHELNEKSYKELQQRKKRASSLDQMIREMELKRELTHVGPPAQLSCKFQS